MGVLDSTLTGAPFTTFSDGSQIVGKYRKTPEGADVLVGLAVEKDGRVLWDSRDDSTRRLRVFPLLREWRLEPRVDQNILCVSDADG